MVYKYKCIYVRGHFFNRCGFFFTIVLYVALLDYKKSVEGQSVRTLGKQYIFFYSHV